MIGGRFSGLFLGKAGRLRSKDASSSKRITMGWVHTDIPFWAVTLCARAFAAGKKSRFPKNALHKVKVIGPFQVQNLYSVLQISAPILFFCGRLSEARAYVPRCWVFFAGVWGHHQSSFPPIRPPVSWGFGHKTPTKTNPTFFQYPI